MLTFKCALINHGSLQIGMKLPGNFTGQIRKAGPGFDTIIPNRRGRLMSGEAFMKKNWLGRQRTYEALKNPKIV
jgi:hypothetical protein